MAWNQRDDALLYAGTTQTQRLGLWHPATRAIGSGLAFALGRSSVWSHWKGVPSFIRHSTEPLGYLIAALLLLSCLGQIFQRIVPRRAPDWEKKLSSSQRNLLGVLEKATEESTRKQTPVQKQRRNSSPLGPPLRLAKPITPSSHATDRAFGDPVDSPVTPYSGGGYRRSSPYQTSPVVTTPEQLKQYLDAFDEHAQASTPSPLGYLPDSSPGSGRFGGGRAHFAQPFGPGEQAIQHYRPSLQARGKAGAPLRADVLLPSSQETFEAVLEKLKTNARTLDVWIDRFREWLSSEVVNPAVRKITTAHQDVASAARALGWTLELSPLTQPEASSSNKGLEADEEAQMNTAREALMQQLRGPLQEPQRKAVLACLQQAKEAHAQAVNQYQRLALLLRGESPRGVLPPVPRGYIAKRLGELARDSCLAAFTWNGGGTWQGKPWTTDLLTDSAVVFYLFAAYLEAPKWYYPLEEARQTNTGAPLYVGSLPSRPAQHCTALLPVRPASLPKGATAILALGLATPEPMLTLVLRGEPALTLTGYTAVFTQLLLLIRSCKLDNFGAIGNNGLKYLELEPVIRPVDPFGEFFRSWFGI